MMHHAIAPSILTVGRQAYSEVCVGSYKLQFKAGDFMSAQVRGEFAFKASMATQSLMRSRLKEMCHSPAAINVSALYNMRHVQVYGQNSSIDACATLIIPHASSVLKLEWRFRSIALGAMPRSRGVPRQGGRSGLRTSLAPADVQHVVPITSASPSSPPSDHRRFIPSSSYQSFRLRFQSRLIHPVVTLNFTVYISQRRSLAPPARLPLIPQAHRKAAFSWGT